MSNSKYAGFWLRFIAYIIDYVVIQILQSFVVVPFLAMLGFSFAAQGFSFDFDSLSEEEIIAMATAFFSAVSSLILLTMAIQVLYYAIMEASKYQATLGKMALGLKVTDMNGQPIDFPKSLLRNLAKIISGMLMMIGYIIAGFTEKKQALHDMIANALVVKN
jgi:uncharacterized RDD family membrane protein YckC